MTPSPLCWPSRGRGRPLPLPRLPRRLRQHERRRAREGFVALGFGVFSIDSRRSGDRGRPGELEEAGADPVALEAMLRGTVVDLRRGIDYLLHRGECHPRRIGYVGLSMGGFLGSMLAGVDERVAAPVLVVSGADWRVFLEGSDALLSGVEADAAALEHAVAVQPTEGEASERLWGEIVRWLLEHVHRRR